MIQAGVLALGLLTVLAQVALAGALGLALAGRRWSGGGRLREALVAEAGTGAALSLAWVVALVAMGGSLFLSEVAHFPPCTLCWYQRCAMYPLAVLLGLAVWRRDAVIRPYALTLAGLGLPISAYHYLVEWFPQMESTSCDPANPCSLVWVRLFGYVSIPMMAGTAFAAIVALMLLAGGSGRDAS